MFHLHILGLAHTVTNQAHSHCAFTGKVLKFPAMMAKVGGFHITHYGVEGAETLADEHVQVMTQEEQNSLRGHDGSDPTKFHGDDANSGNALYQEFNRRLWGLLRSQQIPPDHLVLLPFGHAHAAAISNLGLTLVESGIGYPTLFKEVQHRIFESYAWMHFHHGKEDRSGRNYEWVIPNYFDIDEWDVIEKPTQSNRVVFLGRIDKVKGVSTVVEVAKHRPDLEFVLCGQGDSAPWVKEPNVSYLPPLHGRERSAYLGNALACIMPTVFTEPFGGVAVEAMLCGTPVLSTSYGAFTETIEDEKTGFRCHTLGDFLAGLERCKDLDRLYIAGRAQGLYGYERVGRMYRDAFETIDGLQRRGWYELKSKFGPAVSKKDPWEIAQQEEGRFHASEKWRPNEKRKQRVYQALLDIAPEGVKGKRILDAGSGPQSLLLDHLDLIGRSGVLDPLTFSEEDEERYRQAGLVRYLKKMEDWTGASDIYDEVWCYNVLQHVQDLEAALEALTRMAPMVRLWEWVDGRRDSMHLHVLSQIGIRKVFEDWDCLSEMTGTWTQDERAPDNFYSALFRRK